MNGFFITGFHFIDSSQIGGFSIELTNINGEKMSFGISDFDGVFIDTKDTHLNHQNISAEQLLLQIMNFAAQKKEINSNRIKSLSIN